jgi:hypothetical protein
MPVFTCARRMLPQTVFRNFVLLHAMRNTRAAHSRFALAEAVPPCFIHVLSLRARSPASRLRGTAAPPRLSATHSPTHITCADCPNECLYKFGSRSVQPFGRQRWICSLSVYARVHTCAHTHTHTHTHIHTHTSTYSNKPILNRAK